MTELLALLNPAERVAFEAAFETLTSPAQRYVVTLHLIEGRKDAALLVLAAPSAMYAGYDRALITAFVAGAAANL